ncbi:hypothetical protein E2320_022463, partial [Naja naja]
DDAAQPLNLSARPKTAEPVKSPTCQQSLFPSLICHSWEHSEKDLGEEIMYTCLSKENQMHM